MIQGFMRDVANLRAIGLRPADDMAQDRINLQRYRGVQQRHVPEHVAAMPQHEAEGLRSATQQVRQLL